MKKQCIIAVGFTVDKQSSDVGGLSMMFELFCSIAQNNGYIVHIVSLNSKSNSKVGAISFYRIKEYISILFRILKLLVMSGNSILYFNPSTNTAGGWRDILLIYVSKLLRREILLQQFGALFESYFNSQSKLMQVLINSSYNLANIIIVEGEFAKQQYTFIQNKDKIIAISNGLPEKNNVEQFCGKVFNSSEDIFEMFYMNNMIESKGYVDVLNAIDILVNDYKLKVHCTFAGRFMSVIDDLLFKNINEAQKWFESYITEKKLSESVSYYNCVFDKDKSNCFIASHVFLLPSFYIYEGQPTSILEALSYGSVPIVTNYRLISDMVDTSCGIFVNPQSPEDIANAVRFLMQNSDMYHTLSDNSIRVFKEKFTQDKYANKIVNVLTNNFK
jgi:glycosyltransferase involved in cell wall biosynthesis